MRIGPYSFFERVTAAAQSAPRPKEAAGASGTMNLDGWLTTTEYKQELVGSRGLAVWDRMLRSDSSVAEAAGHITAPVLNANWAIEPYGDLPEDAEIAAAVEKAYFGGWLGEGWEWANHLDELLDYLWLGHYVFEYDWHIVEDELEIDDPSGTLEPDPSDPTGQRKRTKRLVLPRRQFLTFKRFDPRLPSTIVRWVEDHGDLVSVVQQTYKDGSYDEISMDADQLLVFTNKRRGHDYTGRSLLRSAHKSWSQKELVEKVAVIAVERHGVGVPIAYPPVVYKDDEAMMARLEGILARIRSGAFSYIVAPGPKAMAAATAQDGFTFEILAPPGGVPDFTPLLEYLRGEIKGNVLARFSELGHGSTGARATGDVQSEIWYDALHAVARDVQDVHARAIRRFVRANFQTLRYPRLVASDIESKSLAEYAEAIARLATSQALKMDRSARASVRQTIDIPDEDDPTDEPEPEPEVKPPPAAPDDEPIEEE